MYLQAGEKKNKVGRIRILTKITVSILALKKIFIYPINKYIPDIILINWKVEFPLELGFIPNKYNVSFKNSNII